MVEERVRACMKKFAEKNEITFDETKRLQDQKFNSLLFIKFIVDLEDEFEIEIDFDNEDVDMNHFVYLKDFWEYVEGKLES